MVKEVKTMTKDKWINIRCTEEQREDVTELAKKCNMAVSEFFWYLVAKERKEKGNGLDRK
jgi:cell division protein ZapA (FtsZ GTPase activity inhibitor)